MHHVPDDRRAEQSAALLYGGLMSCLETTPLARVSVTEVCSRANVSRSTFYRLFDNVSDVISYRCRVLAGELLGKLKAADGADPRRLAVMLVEGWMDERDIVSALVTNGRLDLLHEAHLALTGAVCDLVFPGEALVGRRRDYFASLVSSMIVAAMREWENGGRADTAEEVYAEAAAFLEAVGRYLSAQPSAPGRNNESGAPGFGPARGEDA